MRSALTIVTLVNLWSVSAAMAQTPLTLAGAMERARTQTPQARALTAGEAEAIERVRRAQGGYMPSVDVTTSVQRGDHPVFVFSSLLAQRRFTEANFAIAALNEPDAVSNVRTFVGAAQPLFDGGHTRGAVRGAELERKMAGLAVSAGRQDLALGAAKAFVQVLQAEAIERAAAAAVAAADGDIERARARREVGLATAADLLLAEVHHAEVRQRHISAASELVIARLELGAATGAHGDELLVLARPEIPVATEPVERLLADAMDRVPELGRARLAVDAAASQASAARAFYFPRIDAQGGVEFNGANLADQRSSWIVGAQLQLNLFRGFADQARLAEARQAHIRTAAERDALARRIEVGVRAAVARLEAARARDVVGRAALTQAREAQRILRDRYETGLATMTDVLRASEATFEAESRAIAAELDVVLQAVALERAIGRL